jgi:hypothetical protein
VDGYKVFYCRLAMQLKEKNEKTAMPSAEENFLAKNFIYC